MDWVAGGAHACGFHRTTLKSPEENGWKPLLVPKMLSLFLTVCSRCCEDSIGPLSVDSDANPASVR